MTFQISPITLRIYSFSTNDLENYCHLSADHEKQCERFLNSVNCKYFPCEAQWPYYFIFASSKPLSQPQGSSVDLHLRNLHVVYHVLMHLSMAVSRFSVADLFTDRLDKINVVKTLPS